MSVFLKATACILVTIVLSLTLSKQGKDFSILLVISACCIVVIVAIGFLKPVVEFFRQLQTLGKIDYEMFIVLLNPWGWDFLRR